MKMIMDLAKWVALWFVITQILMAVFIATAKFWWWVVT
jgi:hypothetical protein